MNTEGPSAELLSRIPDSGIPVDGGWERDRKAMLGVSEFSTFLTPVPVAIFSKEPNKLDMVAHTCHSSSLGGRDQEDGSLRTAWAWWHGPVISVMWEA
jgi:hypothetical protein